MKIDILEIIEKEDGTSEVIFDYDKEFLDYVKLKTNKKKPSKKDISEIFIQCLNNGINFLNESEKEKCEND